MRSFDQLKKELTRIAVDIKAATPETPERHAVHDIVTYRKVKRLGAYLNAA